MFYGEKVRKWLSWVGGEGKDREVTMSSIPFREWLHGVIHTSNSHVVCAHFIEWEPLDFQNC